jgi:hypothetical protein
MLCFGRELALGQYDRSLGASAKMSDLRDPTLVAEDLFEKIGPRAIGVVEFRMESLHQAGDPEAVRYWAQVLRALWGLKASEALRDR